MQRFPGQMALRTKLQRFIRIGFWQNGFFRGFLFLSRRISSRILSPDFFSSFLWEKVPRKILQENPRQNPPKFIQQKSPTIFCRGAGQRFTLANANCEDGQPSLWVSPSHLSKFLPPTRTSPAPQSTLFPPATTLRLWGFRPYI